MAVIINVYTRILHYILAHIQHKWDVSLENLQEHECGVQILSDPQLYSQNITHTPSLLQV